MKLSEIMRGYQSLNSVQTLFKSQSSFMYENLIEDIFSLNNQHPSKAPLQHFYPRDGWMISLIISNEISQPLVSPSHPGSYWSSVASLPDTVLWLVNTSTHQLPVLSLAAGLRTLTGRDWQVGLQWRQDEPQCQPCWPLCSVAYNEEMMRSCNCSKLPQSRPGPYFLPTQRQFQFTAMFGVNYNVSELWAHFSAITVNLRLAVMKWFSIIQ